ncbi:MAG: ribonuclease III [Planctomycetales bacterium]|nr:ribonuclease III [Planctomycetales bacterium]
MRLEPGVHTPGILLLIMAQINDQDTDRLSACQERIRYRFHDDGLLEAALTHASGADHRLESNERMEFLGDAILGGVVCEKLYHMFPDFLEGDLTRLKSVVVSRQTCARVSRSLGLEEYLILGKGMTTSPDVPMSVLADVFESLVAAIFLDGGRDAAAEFILRQMVPEIEATAAGEVGGNYKSQLQQFAQREHGVTPSYSLLDEKGPDHSKCFKIAAQIAGKQFPAAWGRSKKESEQRAAHNAISNLSGMPAPHSAEDLPESPNP